MRCPFIDPEFELPLDEPCPVCGARGDVCSTEEQDKICREASEDDE